MSEINEEEVLIRAIIELINKNEFRKSNIEPLNKFFEYIKNR